MKFGFVMPFGDARNAADLAHLAEESGWDGFFVWEPVWGNDAWISLTAAAMTTQRIRLGTMLSPISRMRPWKLASETASLDRLSNGRVILAVGLGTIETGFAEFGEVTDRKTRAELMDEGLDILTGLWAGQPFHYEGKHYTIRPNEFQPPAPPVQLPRIPIWVVGAWPSQKSMARAVRYDGLLPQSFKTEPDGRRAVQQAGLEELRQMKAYVQAHHGADQPYDIILDGETPGDQPAKARDILQPWSEAGATWWIESRWSIANDAPGLSRVRQRIEQGPPK